MADLSKSQQKRAEARQRRRKQGDEPSPDDGVEAAPSNDEQPQHSVRQAAKVAAAVGAAGAAAAAARALTSHDKGEQPRPQDQPEPEPEQDEPQAADADADEPETEHEPEEQQEPVAGAGQSDARRVLDRGREQLEDLLGRPVESVSSLERTHDGWVLSLEVVEVKRVPETMDVLASYEMELDDDLNLRRYQQARRYHRARADDGEHQ